MPIKKVEAHEVSEQVIRGLVKGVGIQAFFTGLHNAFAHGQIMEEKYTFNDNQLGDMFEHFESLNTIARYIENH